LTVGFVPLKVVISGRDPCDWPDLRVIALPDYLAFEIRGLIFWISLTAEECLTS
jgi:hypothetical protein